MGAILPIMRTRKRDVAELNLAQLLPTPPPPEPEGNAEIFSSFNMRDDDLELDDLISSYLMRDDEDAPAPNTGIISSYDVVPEANTILEDVIVGLSEDASNGVSFAGITVIASQS